MPRLFLICATGRQEDTMLHTRPFIAIIAAALLLDAGQAAAGKPRGAAYQDGGEARVGVILCHGRGQGPRWNVVNPLRKALHRELGYHTLSLQMPAEKKPAREYAEDFPRAYETIQAGIEFLRREKGVTTIYLVGHSMGARMATAFLAAHPDAPVAGFIGVGIRNRLDWPLDSDENLRSIHIPVLDVYGDRESGRYRGHRSDVTHAEERADMVSDRYTQVLIPGADHQFNYKEKEMVAVVLDWLRGQAARAAASHP